MNTALILHLLTLVQHHVRGRHFAAFYIHECFQWVKVASPAATHGPAQMAGGMRLVCGVIHVWQHGASVKWR